MGRTNSLSNEKIYSVLLDTTNTCNLKCTFCTRDNDKIICMSVEELEVILGKLKGRIRALQLSCAWEYSIDKNASEIVKTIGKYNIPSTTIYTNGNILTDKIANELICSQIDAFVISIGETKKETYEKLRKGGKFERVVSNINKLRKLKKEQSSSLPRICANLTLVNSNIRELLDFISFAHGLGIEEIRGRHLILNEGLDMEKEKLIDKASVNRIIDEAEKKSLSYGMVFSVPKYENNLKKKECRAPWNQLYISSNGDVSVCPRIHKYEKVGNLLEDSIDYINNGKEITELKEQFEKNKFKNPVCSICMDNLETEIAIDQGF